MSVDGTPCRLGVTWHPELPTNINAEALTGEHFSSRSGNYRLGDPSSAVSYTGAPGSDGFLADSGASRPSHVRSGTRGSSFRIPVAVERPRERCFGGLVSICGVFRRPLLQMHPYIRSRRKAIPILLWQRGLQGPNQLSRFAFFRLRPRTVAAGCHGTTAPVVDLRLEFGA